MLSAYQKAYTKALGKDGILISHENSAMHQHAAKQADLFKQTFTNPSRRVDSQLLEQKKSARKGEQTNSSPNCFGSGVYCKASLLRGHCDDKVDFVNKDINRGNFIAVLQYWQKETTSFISTFRWLNKIQSTPIKPSKMKLSTHMQEK